MAKQSNLIKLDEFNIQQLPELQNKKQEVAEKLNEFKYVEIVDNSTYEEAKKSRTGARTLRTSLQKEQKDVEKKIKDHILVPVKTAYEEIIDSVLPIENKQQEEVSRWEEIKEQERQEKARLEQERVDRIKKSIGSFREYWEDVISKLTFGEIEPTKDKYSVVVSEFDRNSLEEFEILFTDSVKYLDGVFASRVELLTKEEELRLERERLAEIQAEQNRINAIKSKIDSWEKNWMYVINTLEFKNISVAKTDFETQSALDCQEFQSEYATKRNQIQELLSAKVSQLEEQENQRIERENFLKEKAEFEQKQLKARTESRIKQLTDLGISEDVIFDELGSGKWRNNKNLAESLPDDVWEEHLEWVKNQIELRNKPKEETIKADGYYTSEETPQQFTTKDFDFNKEYQEAFESLLTQEVDFEETWDSIFNDIENWNELVIPYCDIVKKYLVDNYNVPTKK